MNNHWLLKDVFTNTPNVVLAVDQHFHIFDLNPAAATLLGLSRKQVVGQHCSHLMKCRNMNRTLLCGTSNCPVTHVIQLKHPIAQEELILGQTTDSRGEFACSLIPVEHEQSTYVVFAARDISGVKMANRVRANFVSMVSHDLRTPLARLGSRLSFMGLPCPNIFAGEHAFHSRLEWVSRQDMEKAMQTIVHLAMIFEERA